MSVHTHNHWGYSHGCRCGICRDAWAAYRREQRATRARRRRLVEGRPDTSGRHYVPRIRHGYFGYQDYHCRCDVCRAAKAVQDARSLR